MQPIVNGLQASHEDQMTFDAIDAATESGSDLLDIYGLRGHPSYVIVDVDGKALWSFSGQTSEAILRQKIEEFSSKK
ncbi:MAG: hypothetical protein AAF702_12740 [Chloroflexota bacterium]